jgi:hypothetical protein
VTEVMGDGSYVVRPNEAVEFREGRITARNESGATCGCPSTGVPVMRAENKPPEPAPVPTTAAVVEPPQQTAPPQGQPAMQVEAPLVFSGAAPTEQQAPEVASLSMQSDPERPPLQAAPPPAPPAQAYKVADAKVQNRREEKKGFFAKVRGFFGGIFH